MANLNLPYGIDNFEKIRINHCYYIDKTEFIKELLTETFDVNLITRPRRFGKTLTISMLAEFFDIRKDTRAIFSGLAISENPDICNQWQNKWPVLYLTLKDINGRNFQKAYGLLKNEISKLCKEHPCLGKSTLVDPDDQTIFLRLKAGTGSDIEVQCALDTLMRMMKAHYGKPVILLIDEYDVPLAKASDNGYYDDMLDIIRTFLGMAWKSNPSLKFAVVTGCLRIAKESIFTGANNFISNSIFNEHYNRFFGFTQHEVEKLLNDAGYIHHLDDTRRWYDGYRFGGMEVYCPWDVINHIRALTVNQNARPGNYRKDTSHNQIIRRFIDKKSDSVNGKFERLLAGEAICETIMEDLNYDNANSSETYLWSILCLTGYLTETFPASSDAPLEGNAVWLRIPNEEVKTIFADTIKVWFTASIEASDRRDLFKKWWDGDEKALTKEVSDILFDTISYFDYKEDFYHAFLAGLFSGAGYEVKSNSEQGTGRADIIVKERRHRRAIVIEAKWIGKDSNLEKECAKALEQIRRKQYGRNLLMEGFTNILSYGAAFFGKECLIQGGRDQ